MDYKIIFVILLAWTAGSAYGWWEWNGREWSDTIPSDCPSEDPETHVCRSLYAWNATCWKVDCCRNFENWENYIEYDDSDEVYGYPDESCVMCFGIFPCTFYKCFDRCCDGYERDYYGRCSNATGGIECQNGGTRLNGKCVCPNGFSGTSCEIPMCHCENEGDCIVKDGRPFCNCSSDHYGERCEHARCSLRCQNGGRCVKWNEYEMCKCPHEFIGKSCEIRFTSSASCPAPSYQSEELCQTYCMNDEECSGNQVCCKDGCSTKCRNPVNGQCEYMGRTISIGSSFSPDPCTNCTCMEYGHLSCHTHTCPGSNYGLLSCPNQIREPGKCCPTCPDGPNPKPPTIYKCPLTTVRINTTYQDFALLNAKELGIYATDERNMEIPVNLRPDRIQRRPTYEQTIQKVTAYAVDDRGAKQSCSFEVVVKDVTPPIFTSCPGNIYVFENEPVKWVEPSYFDYVGVADHKRRGYGVNGDVFPVGDYCIKYYIWDYDRNTAECYFKVFVIARDTDFDKLPEGLRQRSKDNRGAQLAIILAPILAGLVILAIALSAIFCLLRRKKSQQQRTSTHASPVRYDNDLYAVPDDVMDKDKPPAYPGPQLPQNPPPYSICGSVNDSNYKPESPPSYHNPDYDLEK